MAPLAPIEKPEDIEIDKSDPVIALSKYISKNFVLPKYPSTILPITYKA